MPVLAPEPTARFRKSRTRTKQVNRREPLAISTLTPHQYDLRPACTSVACPDCDTWVPITGLHATIQKMVPHHTTRAGTPNPRRCTPGSNRRVILDVDIACWWEHLEDGVAETTGRQPTRVLPKPQAPAAPAVSQIQVPPQTDATAVLGAYRMHLNACRAGGAADRCCGTHRCAEGARLAALYTQLNRTQPYRDRERQRDARIDALLERHRAAAKPRRRAAEWTAVLPAVQQADAQRAEGIENAVPVRRHTDVPCKKPAHLGG